MKTTTTKRARITTYNAIVQCEESAQIVAVTVKARTFEQAWIAIDEEIVALGGGMRLLNIARVGKLSDIA